jgi:zinc protease
MRRDRISEDELSLARDYLDGVFPIRYETTAAIASALATLVIYSLPADYYDTYRKRVRSVSVNDVLEAARAHLHPNELQTVVVGDAKVIRESVEKLEIGDVQVHEA